MRLRLSSYNIVFLSASFVLFAAAASCAADGRRTAVAAFRESTQLDQLICDFQPSGLGSGASLGKSQTNSQKTLFENRLNHLTRPTSQTTLFDTRESEGDNQLNRQDSTPRDHYSAAQPEASQPTAPSPTGKKPFENLRRYGIPNYRESQQRNEPFAQAATFGAGPGVIGPRYRNNLSSSCQRSRSGVLVYRDTYFLRAGR